MTESTVKTGSFSIQREAWGVDCQWCHVWGDDDLFIPGTLDTGFQDDGLDPQDISVIMKSTLDNFLMEYCIA